MSNHYLKYEGANTDLSKLQLGLAQNPTYQLNELPADEVLRYSLAGVTRVERARLRILLEESFEPEVTLTQSVIAAALIMKYFIQDYAFPAAIIAAFCVFGLVVGIAMVL